MTGDFMARAVLPLSVRFVAEDRQSVEMEVRAGGYKNASSYVRILVFKDLKAKGYKLSSKAQSELEEYEARVRMLGLK